MLIRSGALISFINFQPQNDTIFTENGLVIPGPLKAVTRSRRLGAKFYEEVNKVKQLCAQMDIPIKEMRSKPVRL